MRQAGACEMQMRAVAMIDRREDSLLAERLFQINALCGYTPLRLRFESGAARSGCLRQLIRARDSIDPPCIAAVVGSSDDANAIIGAQLYEPYAHRSLLVRPFTIDAIEPMRQRLRDIATQGGRGSSASGKSW